MNNRYVVNNNNKRDNTCFGVYAQIRCNMGFGHVIGINNNIMVINYQINVILRVKR